MRYIFTFIPSARFTISHKYTLILVKCKSNSLYIPHLPPMTNIFLFTSVRIISLAFPQNIFNFAYYNIFDNTIWIYWSWLQLCRNCFGHIQLFVSINFLSIIQIVFIDFVKIRHHYPAVKLIILNVHHNKTCKYKLYIFNIFLHFTFIPGFICRATFYFS